MTMIELLTPLIQQDNVRNIYFFNGRLLTAEDLSEEQLAHRRQRQQLGQAIGPGVVYGLQVSDATSKSVGAKVEVKPGLALNQWGQAMQLLQPVEISLVGIGPERIGGAGVFEKCEDTPVTDLYTGETSVFVLTITPASDFEGSVPMHELSDDGVMTGCGRRYAVEGVMFNLVGLYHHDLDGTIPGQLNTLLVEDDDNIKRLSKLRNKLAHLCLGTEDVAKFGEDAFAHLEEESRYSTYGTQKAATLTKCEVPLALIHLTSRGIRFIDMWAVRRRPAPISSSLDWPLSVGSRRTVENEAAFLQFQNQLAWLVDGKYEAEVDEIKAIEYFRFLPSAGLLREHSDESHGVNLEAFLSTIHYNTDARIIGGDRLNAVLNRSFYHEPIDLDDDAKKALVMYKTQENKAAVETDPPTASSFVLYTSPYMPMFDTAQFNELNKRWWVPSYFGEE